LIDHLTDQLIEWLVGAVMLSEALADLVTPSRRLQSIRHRFKISQKCRCGLGSAPDPAGEFPQTP